MNKQYLNRSHRTAAAEATMAVESPPLQAMWEERNVLSLPTWPGYEGTLTVESPLQYLEADEVQCQSLSHCHQRLNTLGLHLQQYTQWRIHVNQSDVDQFSILAKPGIKLWE